MRWVNIVTAAAMAAAAVSTPALAQRNRNQAGAVVALNYQRVLAETALGRDMATKLQQIRAQVGTEAQSLGPERQSIEQEQNRLRQATRNMSEDQIRNSTTYAPQFQALAQRLQQFQARSAGLQGDLECTQLLSLRDFDRQVTPVIRGIMEQRGAGIAVDSNNVQLVLPQYDITQTVIEQLDQNPATRTATVNRHAVSECTPQQAQQPAQAPASPQ